MAGPMTMAQIEGMYTVGGGLAMRGGPIRATTGPVYAAPQHARAPALRALM
ncbi:hypothetical protein ABH935_000609 [Catenulispora sp. GAS73]|uniref:hypothetical protein n=1 Tax=Catenulispora sp. GAS73 TaxID=3156269 RepID=UPI003512F30B